MRVHELMSTPPVTAPPTLPLADAAHLMRSRGIRRLPVMDGPQLVGIVTDRDLREAMPSRLSTLSPWEATTRLAALHVSDVMRRSVLTTTLHAQARDAAQTMLTHRVGALPVLNEYGQLMGVITVSDVLRDYAAPHGSAPDSLVPDTLVPDTLVLDTLAPEDVTAGTSGGGPA